MREFVLHGFTRKECDSAYELKGKTMYEFDISRSFDGNYFSLYVRSFRNHIRVREMRDMFMTLLIKELSAIKEKSKE